MPRNSSQLWSWALLLLGCTPSFPYPYTKGRLAVDSVKYPGHALVHYLGQHEADVGVCALANGPAARMSEDEFAIVADALAEGKVSPEKWRQCVGKMLAVLKPEPAAAVFRVVATRYVESLALADPGSEAKAAVLHRLILNRPATVRLPNQEAQEIRTGIEELITKRELTPQNLSLGREMIDTLDLEAGRWRGRPVSAQILAEVDSEELLQRMMLRLPTEELRAGAKRRLVALRIAASPFPEVQKQAKQVEERLMTSGVNAIRPQATPRLTATVEKRFAKQWTVLVRQSVYKHRATLLAKDGGQPKPTVLPAIDLRQRLQINVPGYSRPVTLCGDRKDLDPSPCIHADDLVLGNPVAHLDELGAIHFVEDLSTETALELLGAAAVFSVKPTYGTVQLAKISLPIRYEKPTNLYFRGGTGGRGPDISVEMFEVYGRTVIAVTDKRGGPPTVAILEKGDVDKYSVVSQGGTGAAGASGSPGMNGHAGSPGMNAICPYSSGTSGGRGGDGGRGGNGGPGGPGGNGGNVKVVVRCLAKECKTLKMRAEAMVKSMGGAGGPGGSGGAGGQGGPGGRGGSGTSCTSYETRTSYSASGGTSTQQVPVSKSLSGGSQGMSGSNGRRGMDGANGPPGRPGRVTVTAAPWKGRQAALARIAELAASIPSRSP